MEDVPYGRILREGWILIVVLALVGAVSAGVLTRFLPTTYSATTTMMLQVDTADASLFERNQFSLSRIQTYPALVDSPAVIGGVRNDLGQDAQEYTDGQLREMLTARVTDDTVLLRVQADAPTAVLSKDLANSAAEHLSALVDETENSGAGARNTVKLVPVLSATEPESPDSPNVTAITGLGMIAGLALGAITAVYRTATNRRLLTISDVRRSTGLPVVAQLPSVHRATTEPAPVALFAYQDATANLAILGGHGRDLFVVVPTADAVLDDDTLVELLHAYARKRVRACAMDLRDAPSAVAGARPWTELLETPESSTGSAAPDGDGQGRARPQADLFTSDRVVGAEEIRTRIPVAVEALRAEHDVVLVVCDSASATLLARLADLGAGFVVAVRHRHSSAIELISAVTSLRVMNLHPLGVMMVHTPRGAQENIAESWRRSDGEDSAADRWAATPLTNDPRDRFEVTDHAEGRGHRARA